MGNEGGGGWRHNCFLGIEGEAHASSVPPVPKPMPITFKEKMRAGTRQAKARTLRMLPQKTIMITVRTKLSAARGSARIQMWATGGADCVTTTGLFRWLRLWK